MARKNPPRTIRLSDSVRDLLVQAAVSVVRRDPHSRPVVLAHLAQQLIENGAIAICNGDYRELSPADEGLRLREDVADAANCPRSMWMPPRIGEVLVLAATAVARRDPFHRAITPSQLASSLLREGCLAILRGKVRPLARTRVTSGRKGRSVA